MTATESDHCCHCDGSLTAPQAGHPASEIGYIPKMFPELTEEQRQEVGEFLQALEENDDVHRVWAAAK